MIDLPLHGFHQSLGATFGEFAGHTMPLYYAKPLEEHHTVRKGVGVFDISHMGQFAVAGKRAGEFLQFALTNDVAAMADGEALYSPMCREDGGVLDDLIVYRLSGSSYRIIVNAGNHAKDLGWLLGLAAPFSAIVTDLTREACLLAVQGPLAFERLAPHLDPPPGRLGYYRFAEGTAFGEPALIARTGYTGEPGCEISIPRKAAPRIWERLTGDLAIPPIGLAARDTLRLEACLALYGHELRDTWHPLESGLAWAVKLEKPENFIGKEALLAVRREGSGHLLAGLEMSGRGIPRADYPVLHDGRAVGIVTSGALSPTTGKSVALARVETPLAKRGTALAVEIRGRPVAAIVVPRPFYRNPDLRA